MADTLTETGTLYSPAVGLVYVFNLIVGTGALTMPSAFDSAGWLVSLFLVISLAFMSYLTATFVIETMATANAVRRLRDYRIQADVKYVEDTSSPAVLPAPHAVQDETTPLMASINADVPGNMESNVFEITERIEMGQMASLFFNKVGVVGFYICIAVYLYGDLAIYAAAVPKSMRDVACTFYQKRNSCDHNSSAPSDSDLCWENVPSIDRQNAYRIFLAVFAITLCPFVFFNIQKTKFLQIFTTIMRWIAFGLMIILAVIRLAKGEGRGNPPIADLAGIPTLFGVCVYSFMCHHSLPSLATPIRNKSKIYSLFAADYVLILSFYAVLSFTGIFSFRHIRDLYTLNFQPDTCESDNHPITTIEFFQYFLALFPVFTLSTNFPIIAITLRNNLKTLFHKEGKTYPWVVDRILFPLLTIIPPLLVAFLTNNVGILVGITGSYAGAGIQYVVPVALVYFSRRTIKNTALLENKYRSPFKHNFWIIFVFIWAVICIGFVTVNHILIGH